MGSFWNGIDEAVEGLTADTLALVDVTLLLGNRVAEASTAEDAAAARAGVPH